MSFGEQKRFKSPIVITSIIFAVGYIAKEFFNLEIEDKFTESLVIIFFAIWQIFSSFNNPKDTDKF